MKRYLLLLLTMLVLGGCAAVEAPPEEAFPFRAALSVEGRIAGHAVEASGGVLLVDTAEGMLQVYGPGAMAVSSLSLKDGRLLWQDMWGRTLEEMDMPAADFPGLLAGVPPRAGRIVRQGRTVRYTWGRVELDEHGCPVQVQVRGTPGTRITTQVDGRHVLMAIVHGTDYLQLRLEIREGGQWL